MTGRKNRHELLYPLGVTPTEEGAEILVQAEGKKVSPGREAGAGQASDRGI